MKKNNYLLLTMLFLLSPSFIWAQSKISGRITDSQNDEGIIGANIYVKGTTLGTVTDIDGNYTIENFGSAKHTIVVSYIGYITEEINIDLTDEQSQTIDVAMTMDVMQLTDIIVTGVMNSKSKIESSVSITTLEPKTINESVPRTTAEIFRNIPGIKVEASAGEGNTNMTVRGVPISAGGSRYLQLQEDGLPVMLYGDIAFGTQDQFVRADQNLARIEAIRGGSAATTTSNGPAGIINLISKTGDVEGGSVSTNIGLDYNSLRSDFEYGSPIGNGLSFHIGGFYRQGEGPRNANHVVNKGGQFKANITKHFSNGFARIHYKMLNDRTAGYMPAPIEVSGSNSSPNWRSVRGFDAQSNGLHSPFFRQSFGFGPDGEFRNASIADGIHSKSNSIGAELEFDLPNNWKIANRSRMSFNSGRFLTPFTAQVGGTQTIADEIVRSVGDTTAAGAPLPYDISKVSDGSRIGSSENDLIQRIHLFDVELENFNNFVSDTRINKSWEVVDLTVGFFKANQNIEMAWLWNSYLMEVADQADLLNITTYGADTTNLTTNGQLNYGVPFWGNCCTGKYNLNYDIQAPYLNLEVNTGNFNIDGGVRFEKVKVNGTVAPSQQIANVDMNGNGIIDVPERSVSRVDNANAKPVNYEYDYVSYSVGLNYKFDDFKALFGRVSQGYVGNAERAVWHQGGPYLENKAPKNSLFQAELGYKHNFQNAGLFVTGFYSKTEEEAGVEATTQRVLSNDYRSFGIEIENDLRFGGFSMRTALTYTNAEIVDNNDKVNIGNTPRRQPAFQYSLLPVYTFNGGHAIGISLIGQTKAYAQDNNELIMPGYAFVNIFGSAQLTKGLSVNVNVNNLFNTIGITESEEGSITEGITNYVRARSISGRSTALSIAYTF